MMARQISLRLNDEEEARLTEVCQRVSDRAGVRVDQTLVVKALIGFRQFEALARGRQTVHAHSPRTGAQKSTGAPASLTRPHPRGANVIEFPKIK